MTTKYKIDFGNGTAFEATCERDKYGYRFDFLYLGDSAIEYKNSLYEKTLERLGAKVTSISPKEPFRFEAEVQWRDSDDGPKYNPRVMELSGERLGDWSDLIGKRGKLIFIEGESE